MRELIGAPIVFIEAVTSERHAARYIAKYLGKDPEQFGKQNRYFASRKWEQAGADEATEETWDKEGWEYARGERYTDLVQNLVSQGYYPQVLPGRTTKCWKPGCWPEHFFEPP